MTSSYCYAQVRVRRFGEAALPEPSWPESIGTMSEYNYANARQAFDKVEVLNADEKKAFAEGRFTSHGGRPVVYKEFVLMEYGSRTFYRKMVFICDCKGDPVPTTLEIMKPRSFKEAPLPFQRWWLKNVDRLSDSYRKAFLAGRKLGRNEGKENSDEG